MAVGKQQTMKAQLTRASLIVAAAAILREDGPASVTYRGVADKAGAASSSVGYYFESIDMLLGEAADFNVRLWLQRAESAAQLAESLSCSECGDRLVELLLQACLPEDFSNPAAHYSQLMNASAPSTVARSYGHGRSQLESAVARILSHAGYSWVNPRTVIALVDGASVAGALDGCAARDIAQDILREYLESPGGKDGCQLSRGA